MGKKPAAYSTSKAQYVRYLKKNYRPLSAEEERSAIAAWQEKRDVASRDRVVMSYLPLAMNLASRYGKERLDDYLNSAVLAMIHAIDRFDLSKENRFGVYAAWWIRDEFTKVTNGSSIIKLPGNLHRNRSRVLMEMHKIRHEHPEYSMGAVQVEVSKLLEIPLSDLQYAIKVLSANAVVDINHPIMDDGSALQDIIPDRTNYMFADTEESMDEDDRRAILKMALDALNNRERDIISARYMTDKRAKSAVRGCTLEVLGEQFGISKERVRQIETKGLKKLRAFVESHRVQRINGKREIVEVNGCAPQPA